MVWFNDALRRIVALSCLSLILDCLLTQAYARACARLVISIMLLSALIVPTLTMLRR